jgi:peptidoglycan/xylan/chitin deacetylase (PgdA/CDA1 family)
MATSKLRAGSCRVARRLLRHWTAAQAPQWDALQRELDLWAARRRQVVFWWRDDDARTATPALDQLLDTAARFDMPLALAVIPVGVEAALEARLMRAERVRVFQHGWDHVNHADPARPAELSETRDADEVGEQLGEGRRRLQLLFGARFLPVLVPPFNQLSRHLNSAVERVGYRFISSQGDFAGLPLPYRNTHLDVIDWQRNQAADPSVIVRLALAALRLRRLGLVPASSPVGMVTHHLAHDTAVWDLVETLLRRLRQHPAVIAPEIERIFAP